MALKCAQRLGLACKPRLLNRTACTDSRTLVDVMHNGVTTSAFASSLPAAAVVSESARFAKRRRTSAKCRPRAMATDRRVTVTGSRVILLPSPEYTCLLGRALARGARAGDVLCLCGDLGSGKTSFARGYVRAARRDEALDVTSPTFCLDNTYPPEPWELEEGEAACVPTIHHMDLWRLKSAADRSIVDFDHVFRKQIALVEWPERLGSLLPDERLEVRIVHEEVAAGPDSKDAGGDDLWGFEDEDNMPGRIATLEPHGPSWRARVAAMDLSDLLVK